MDKIVLDRSKLLGFDHPSNLKAKVGGKPVTIQPQVKPEISRDGARAVAR